MIFDDAISAHIKCEIILGQFINGSMTRNGPAISIAGPFF